MLKQQLLDYIFNHEEVKFYLEEYQYHICRSHKAARAVIQNGFLPASFRCSLDNGQRCPMQQILKAARGKSVELIPSIL